jgi:hypothetical protein
MPGAEGGFSGWGRWPRAELSSVRSRAVWMRSRSLDPDPAETGLGKQASGHDRRDGSELTAIPISSGAVDHGVNYVDTADCHMGGKKRTCGRAWGVRMLISLEGPHHGSGMIRSWRPAWGRCRWT